MIETQFTELLNLLDFKLAALIFLSSYWVKSNFKDIAPKINLSIKIFIWSTLISIVYYTISKTSGLYQTGEWYNMLITYFTVTSFYELAFKPLENFVNSKIKKDNGQ